MTNQEVIAIWKVLNEVDFGEVSVKFTLKKSKLKKKLDDFIEPFKEVDKTINELSSQAKALVETDEDGDPIVKDGKVMVIDGKEEEFKELDNKLQVKNEERQQLILEEADIELEKLPLDEFPNKLEDKHTEALIPIIEE